MALSLLSPKRVFPSDGGTRAGNKSPDWRSLGGGESTGALTPPIQSSPWPTHFSQHRRTTNYAFLVSLLGSSDQLLVSIFSLLPLITTATPLPLFGPFRRRCAGDTVAAHHAAPGRDIALARVPERAPRALHHVLLSLDPGSWPPRQACASVPLWYPS